MGMASDRAPAQIRLIPWQESDLDFERSTNTPEMQAFLGGVESDERIVARHQRVLALARDGVGQLFRVELADTGESVGSVGYWERDWQGETVYEAGWKVLSAFQGRGIAVSA